jgi:hypothetical protein
MTDIRPLFDPKLDSRGIWHIYKIKAIQAQTDQQKTDFFKELMWLSQNFPCAKCRKHMTKYIQNEPFDLYMNVTVGDNDVGCFKYISNLQNSVNLKLGKPLVPFDVAYSMYNPNNIHACSSGCDEDSDNEDVEQKQVEKEKISTSGSVKGNTVKQVNSVTPMKFIPSARK